MDFMQQTPRSLGQATYLPKFGTPGFLGGPIMLDFSPGKPREMYKGRTKFGLMVASQTTKYCDIAEILWDSQNNTIKAL